MFFTYYLRVT